MPVGAGSGAASSGEPGHLRAVRAHERLSATDARAHATYPSVSRRFPSMTNAAIIVLAGTDSPADLGRVVNALEAAREFRDEGDDFELIFDGAGTQWVGELDDEDHDYHDLYQSIRDDVSVCDYCVSAYDVDDVVDEEGLERLDEFEGHPSIRSLVDDGYEIITF